MAAIQDWSELFLPADAPDAGAVAIDIEDDDDYLEVTGDMLVALPEAEPDDEVTEPLPELCSDEVDKE